MSEIDDVDDFEIHPIPDLRDLESVSGDDEVVVVRDDAEGSRNEETIKETVAVNENPSLEKSVVERSYFKNSKQAIPMIERLELGKLCIEHKKKYDAAV